VPQLKTGRDELAMLGEYRIICEKVLCKKRLIMKTFLAIAILVLFAPFASADENLNPSDAETTQTKNTAEDKMRQLCDIELALNRDYDSLEECEKRFSEHIVKSKEFMKFAIELCEHSYPRKDIDECYNNFYHSIASALDPHSNFIDKEEQKRFRILSQGSLIGVGIETTKPSYRGPLIIKRILPNSPAKKAGILPMDVITHIDEVPTSSLQYLIDAVKMILGEEGTAVKLRIARSSENEPLEFSIIREKVKVTMMEKEMLSAPGKLYGLIRVREFIAGSARDTKQAFEELSEKAGDQNLAGIIIDLQNNPGGILNEALSMLDLFMDKPSFALYKDNKGAALPIMSYFMRTVGDITKGLPILVIVNSGSASASEIFSGAMKHFGRAVIAGPEKTYGKGSIQRCNPIIMGIACITSAEYLIGTVDDWEPIQCNGVEPDVLFDYPSEVKHYKYPRECDTYGAIKSIGEMPNAPERKLFIVEHPQDYEETMKMLEVFKKYETTRQISEQKEWEEMQKKAKEQIK